MNVIETSSGIATEIEKGIIHFQYFKGIEITEEQVQENLDLLEDYVNKHGKIKLILEIPSTTYDSSEAFEYLNNVKYKNKNTVAMALIVKSIAQRLNSKYYHTNIETGAPTAFFKTFDEALVWVKTI